MSLPSTEEWTCRIAALDVRFCPGVIKRLHGGVDGVGEIDVILR